MDLTEGLKSYYDNLQKELKIYLDNKLQEFKDSNKQYLSAVIADAVENAKHSFEKSNQFAFEMFEKQQLRVLKLRNNNHSSLADILEKSAKSTLDNSLKFNMNVFENSVAYYKNLLNK
ncbi:MAG: hypothetical protein WDK96_02200 [Candidatus Paceibacterota bacterium]|jgi:hypothetical protein